MFTKLYNPVEVVGKEGITAKVILDSVNPDGVRLTTYELVYNRTVHSEFMTHKMISKNAASSRAIPFGKMVEQTKAVPVFFGKNQSGMQASEELSAEAIKISKHLIDTHRQFSNMIAERLFELGNHKQVFNRYTEAHQMIKVVASATEWDNFFWLRNDNMADPIIHELAKCMYEARLTSKPQQLLPDEWHLPYVDVLVDQDGNRGYYIELDNNDYMKLFVEDAIEFSSASCASVSFRNTDYGLEKCKEVHERLVSDKRKHASAMEHQCKVFTEKDGCNLVYASTWEEGITHIDRQANLWSANMREWVQYRKLITGENCTDYEDATR